MDLARPRERASRYLKEARVSRDQLKSDTKGSNLSLMVTTESRLSRLPRQPVYLAKAIYRITEFGDRYVRDD